MFSLFFLAPAFFYPCKDVVATLSCSQLICIQSKIMRDLQTGIALTSNSIIFEKLIFGEQKIFRKVEQRFQIA